MALTSLLQQKIVDHIVSGRCWNLPDFIKCYFHEIEKVILVKSGDTSIFGSGELEDRDSLLLTIGTTATQLKADVLDAKSVDVVLQEFYDIICEYIVLVYYLESVNLLVRTKSNNSPDINLEGNFYVKRKALDSKGVESPSESSDEYKRLVKIYRKWEGNLVEVVHPLWYDTFIPLPSLKDYKKNEYRTDAELEQIHNKKVLNWTRAAAIGALIIPIAVGIMQIINTQDMKIVKPVKVEINADSLAHTLLPMIQQKMSPMTTNTVTISKEKRSKRTAK